MLTPSFNSSGNWQNLGVLSGAVAIIDGRWRYINKLFFSQLLTNTTVLIYSSAQNAKPTWNYAGNANMNIRNTVNPGFGSSYNVTAASRAVYLGFSILRFPDLGIPEYGLEVFVPKWFNAVEYHIWQYTGDGVPNLEGKLDRIYEELIA